MKTYLIKLMVLGLIFFNLKTYCQSNIAEAHFKDGDIALNNYLNKKFAEESKKYTLPSCVISTVFVKFKIDSIGNVKSVRFSALKGTPQIFKIILEATIKNTSGLWIPRELNGRSAESKPFILPLVFEMESGCPVLSKATKTIHKSAPNQVVDGLLGILEFEDNVGTSNTLLDCVILKPLHVFSIN